MAYEIPNLTDSGGIESVAGELARQVNYFWAGILFMIFFVIWGTGYFAQQRLSTNGGNAAMWAAIAGLITTFASFILFLYDNLVTIEVPIICLVITIIAAASFILSSNK